MGPGLRRLVAAAALVGMAALGWWYFASPERRLLRRLDGFGELLGKDGPESQLVAAASARGVAGYFAPGFFVRAEPYQGQLGDPQELIAAVMRLRGAGERVQVAFSERDVQLAAGARTAVVGFVATASVDRGAGPGRESWRVRSLWVDDDGEWRISELELLEQVERSGLFPGL